MAVQSKARVCSLSLAGITGSNHAEGMDVSLFKCCVRSGRGLCDGLIPRPEKSYLVFTCHCV